MRSAFVTLFAVVAAVVFVQPVATVAQKSKPVDTTIQLQATFRDAATDGISSDRRGVYAGSRFDNVSIDADGNLRFTADPQSPRTITLTFTDLVRAGEPNLVPPGPSEAVDGHAMLTMFSSAEPKLNLRLMHPGDTAPVRLYIQFTTVTGYPYYYLRGDPDTAYSGSDVAISGPVQVAALDKDSDGVVDCWVLEPLPETDSQFQLVRRVKVGSRMVVRDYGVYRMPFLLTLDQMK